ncbi:hypothetical protein BZA70DRAFT_278818 [Myxozyma melibiosi]|uniref:SWI5-dependent HO expression protein 3 n=1 Tax=Myxozyma melibiosi TaxID=54550 RepID=A0ABR1F7E4_9ASCO
MHSSASTVDLLKGMKGMKKQPHGENSHPEKDKVRIQILRSEIAQRSLELMSLESIAKQLPKATLPPLGRSTSPESLSDSPISSSSNSPTLLSSPDLNDGEQQGLPQTGASSNNKQQQRMSYQFSPEEYRICYEHAMSGSTQQQQQMTVSNTSTTRAIEHLHSIIDSLERDRSLQAERAKEERQRREAISRKFESHMEQFQRIRHENDMFNKILDRRDRKIAELETKAQSESKIRQEREQELKEVSGRIRELEREVAKEKEMRAKEEEKRLQAEASYETLASSTKAINTRLREDVNGLKSEVQKIAETRAQDQLKIRSLSDNLSEMSAEKAKLIEAHEAIQLVHTEKLTTMKQQMSEMQEKVNKSVSNDEQLLKQVKAELEKMRWMGRNSASGGEDISA